MSDRDEEDDGSAPDEDGKPAIEDDDINLVELASGCGSFFAFGFVVLLAVPWLALAIAPTHAPLTLQQRGDRVSMAGVLFTWPSLWLSAVVCSLVFLGAVTTIVATSPRTRVRASAEERNILFWAATAGYLLALDAAVATNALVRWATFLLLPGADPRGDSKTGNAYASIANLLPFQTSLSVGVSDTSGRIDLIGRVVVFGLLLLPLWVAGRIAFASRAPDPDGG